MHFGHAPSLARFLHDVIAALGRCGEGIDAHGRPIAAEDGAVSGGQKKRLNHRLKDELEALFLPSEAASSSLPLALLSEAGSPSGSAADTWVFPTSMCGPVGVTQDAWATAAVLAAAASHDTAKATTEATTVRLATAYLNPSAALLGALRAAAGGASGAGRTSTLEVMTAHAESHGFKSAKGAMALVPKCYAHISAARVEPALTRFPVAPVAVTTQKAGASATTATTVTAAAEGGSVSLLAYRRPHWTFHAKGIWMRRDAVIDTITSSTTESAAATVMGSSNYGRRSSELDLEAQLVVLTESPPLLALLDEEWTRLASKCEVTQLAPDRLRKARASAGGCLVAAAAAATGRFL